MGRAIEVIYVVFNGCRGIMEPQELLSNHVGGEGSEVWDLVVLGRSRIGPNRSIWWSGHGRYPGSEGLGGPE